MHIFLVVMVATLAGVGAAMAQGASSAPPSVTANDPTGQLIITANRMRFLLAAKPEDAINALAPAEARLLRAAGGNADNLQNGLWRRGIGQSTQFVRLAGNTAETLWWNPLTDAGLALRWRHDGTKWIITAAAPVLGESLRGSPIDAAVDPAQSLPAAARALQIAVASGGLEKAFRRPASPDDIAARDMAQNDSFAQASAALDVTADRLIAGEVLLVRTAIPNGPLAVFLNEMGSEARLLLAPRRLLKGADGDAIVWGTAGAPDSLILMDYSVSSPTETLPTRIAIIDLFQASGGRP